jgi:hypothetical protein
VSEYRGHITRSHVSEKDFDEMSMYYMYDIFFKLKIMGDSISVCN